MSMLPCKLKVSCGVAKTKQKVGIEHDINKLVARYRKTGSLPINTDAVGQFLDTTGIGDYQECQQKIIDAQNAFLSYAPEIRRRFNNDISEFSSFMMNIHIPENTKLATELGIIKPKAVEPDKKATAINDDKGGDKK